MNQQRYASEVFKRFGMSKSNIVGTPIVLGTKLFRSDSVEIVNSTQFK